MSTNQRKITIDDLDLKIINILAQDAKISYADIGSQLDVSAGTVFVRVKKLIESNVINGSRMIIDKANMGYKVEGFFGVTLNTENSISKVKEQISKLEAIIEVHTITGSFSLLCRFMCKHLYEVGQIIQDQMLKIPGISNVEAMVSIAPPVALPLHFNQEE